MLIVGCGDVGRRIASRARQRGEPVTCVVRQAWRPDGAPAGPDTLVADLDDPAFRLPSGAVAESIHYLVPPPASGETDPRLARFLDALPTDRRLRIVYVGTTGVYGDCGGAWVDETRPLNPQVDRARRRAAAERLLADWRATGRGEAVILRVAGIYGPDKLPLDRLRRQVPMVAADDAPWTNRIHIEDLVTVCEAAMARGIDGEAYNVSDGQPGNMRDYFDRVADLYGLARAPVVSMDAAPDALSAGLLSYLGESRRLDNRKMLVGLGVTLTYPDLEAGLRQCLAQDRAAGRVA